MILTLNLNDTHNIISSQQVNELVVLSYSTLIFLHWIVTTGAVWWNQYIQRTLHMNKWVLCYGKVSIVPYEICLYRQYVSSWLIGLVTTKIIVTLIDYIYWSFWYGINFIYSWLLYLFALRRTWALHVSSNSRWAGIVVSPCITNYIHIKQWRVIHH